MIDQEIRCSVCRAILDRASKIKLMPTKRGIKIICDACTREPRL